MRPIEAEDRSALDGYISELVRLSDGYSLEDFRKESIKKYEANANRAKSLAGGVAFVLVFFLILSLAMPVINPFRRGGMMLAAALWSFSAGGIGSACNFFAASIGSDRQLSLRTNPSGTIFILTISSLFSLVISISFLDKIIPFFEWLSNIGRHIDASSPPNSVYILVPFFLGYGFIFILAVFQKTLLAFAIVFGIDVNDVEKSQNRLDKRVRRGR